MRALAADAAATHAAAATRVPAALRQPLLLGRVVQGGAAPGDVSRDLPGFAQPRMPPPHLRPHVAPLLLEEEEGGSPPP